MSDEQLLTRPLITVTNLIWSFDATSQTVQLLLVRRDQEPFADSWALPETLLRRHESADDAAIRLIKDKIGLELSLAATEQLATFTAPDRVPGERALALAYMTFLPSMPALTPGYGASEVAWFTLQRTAEQDTLQNGRRTFILNRPALAFDHDQIIATALTRIQNKLDYQPTVLRILGQQFTLKEARNVYATFLKTTPAAIDNSNFRKTHAHLFEECGTATPKQSGRPPKIYRLRG
ncbi:NUDIX hydrolase [Limosilactobacillus fermentum]|uniref:NUDIX hydrolase n=1 Tax=Limosilactobacillus fermentum TaxID=1613 RepID=UPI00019C6865|nr:NUDIX domain-containing protein [Limosilactobacillus fermentum]EEI22994.1 hydrolase, NUDIX family [Limosilactobacillus fermentum ATCC 14931]MCH5402421.1 NUDIX domain-containing protein [Limosilactobacillus fermentum]MDC6125881.1 NUDIX domain-containing protein [Limosilactobacillus fermentum]MDG9735097.1 NUDIX domain-containing protein [Limosilactobacillus fermentum]QCJ27343.1 NUDIX domain-containing protein [Limosilactobacillus fermentum]